jgi:hypothetical protein
VVGSSLDDDYCTVFVCVSPRSCVERVVLTKCSREEVAQALGLVVSTSRAKRVGCTTRSTSVVENLPSAPPCPPYQTTSNEALHTGDNVPNLNAAPSSPAVDNTQHQDRAVAPGHHSGVDRSRAVAYEQASEIEDKGGVIRILPDHTTLGDEVFSAGAKSPNTATQEAMKHQRNSNDLFDDPFEPSDTTASPQSLYSCAEQDGQIPENGSTSPVPRVQLQKETRLIPHDERNNGPGSDRQSCTNQSDTRSLKRRRSLHDSNWIKVKRRCMDSTYAAVDHMRV